MKVGLTGFVLVVVMLALPGCRALGGSCHDPAPYTAAETAPPLQIPPGLDAPDTSNALQIPELEQTPPPPRKPGQPCLDAPPKYEIPKQPEA